MHCDLFAKIQCGVTNGGYKIREGRNGHFGWQDQGKMIIKDVMLRLKHRSTA